MKGDQFSSLTLWLFVFIALSWPYFQRWVAELSSTELCVETTGRLLSPRLALPFRTRPEQFDLMTCPPAPNLQREFERGSLLASVVVMEETEDEIVEKMQR